MTVYRVQDADGRGPWRPGFSLQWIDGDAPSGRLSETVMDLVPIDVLRSLPTDRHYGCGCESRDALLEWFTPVERFRLANYGYRVVRMNVDQVLARSPWQVFFARCRPLADGATVVRWS